MKCDLCGCGLQEDESFLEIDGSRVHTDVVLCNEKYLDRNKKEFGVQENFNKLEVMIFANMHEQLADYAHEAWSGWMSYLFEKSIKNADGSITIPATLVTRWARQMSTPYQELPEEEKESDRTEAMKMIAIMTLNKGRL